MNFVKTTMEAPGMIFRRARSKAAEQGIPLRQFVTEAVEDKLKMAPAAGQKPWTENRFQPMTSGLRPSVDNMGFPF